MMSNARITNDPVQVISMRALDRQVVDGFDDLNIQKRKAKGAPVKKQPMRLRLRWVVEGTNSWLSNYGQLRRNTDRSIEHRHAQRCLATVLLITAKLIEWRGRWSPESSPIR